MRINIFSFLLVCFCLFTETTLFAQHTTLLKDVYIRDPYILPVKKNNIYYMYRSASVRGDDGKMYGGVEVLKSNDLEHWSTPKQVFRVHDDNWITGAVWAPEVHEYKGKYYLFATLNTDLEWKKASDGGRYTFRGTQVFRSSSPEGPFLPMGNTPFTPMDEMALDGTLWVEDGQPYMIYCHEWLQVVDGGMNLIPLKKDMSAPIGQPLRLFCGSSASWATGGGKMKGETIYVTDGCFLYRTKTGKLLMIWSSFMHGNYAIGIAESTTGKVTGPWKQQKEPIFSKDGGHGMIFKDFEERLNLVIHSPNSPSGKERARIMELEDLGYTLKVK